MNTYCPDNVAPPLAPSYEALKAASAMANESADATNWTVFHYPKKVGYQEMPEAVGTQCQLTLHLTFFFDGTGNNRIADKPTQQQTNIVKLFRSHFPMDKSAGIYPFYMPGVGTYFPEIGDPGGTRGLAFADGGQARIDWAIKQLDQTVAKHPPDKLVKIRISAFGFSRGAAEARAFANQVASRCTGKPADPHWDKVDVPLDFYFLGLLDTVASVGLPANASTLGSIRRAKDWSSIETIMSMRRSDLAGLAFGRPGADPTPSIADGHMEWGKEMKIPAMVKKCVSLVAAHEQRNSFPLDSVREGIKYSPNCEEFFYPGAHSDVGGGYRSGDQNKSADPARMLSLMPLFHMHSLAIDHGVPLQGVDQFSDADLPDVFQVTDETVESWNHYMAAAVRGGQPIGDMYLEHMRLWFAWRFQRINRFYNQNASEWSEAQVVPHQQKLKADAARYATERERIQERIDQLENAPGRLAAEHNLQRATNRLWNARRNLYASAEELTELIQAKEEAKKVLQRANEPLRRAEELFANVPPSDYVRNLHQYDVALMRDIKELQRLVDVYGWPLRPFYRMLLETYDAEFTCNSGLRDEKIIKFFDSYVHDSLAGFAKDATAPSDPRCVYVGADHEVRYAGLTEENAAVEVT